MTTEALRLLRPEAVAARCGVELADLPKLVKSGRIPAPKIVGKRSKRWIEHALEECLRRRARPLPPNEPDPICNHPQKDEPTCLYRHWSRSGDLLYVGIALSPIERLGGHRAASPWFRAIARIEIQWYPNRVAALRAERKAIRNEKPKHNTMMVPR